MKKSLIWFLVPIIIIGIYLVIALPTTYNPFTGKSDYYGLFPYNCTLNQFVKGILTNGTFICDAVSASINETDPAWTANYSLGFYLNHTLSVFNLWGQWFTNQTIGAINDVNSRFWNRTQLYNKTEINIFNSSWSSTYNQTYNSNVANNSFNQTLTDTLYAERKWGYNETYSGAVYNTTYHIYAYNQTYSGSTYNQTYSNYAYNETYSGSTYNASYHGLINNASYLSTYNATYNTYAYNQTYSGSTYNETYSTYVKNYTNIVMLNQTINQNFSGNLSTPAIIIGNISIYWDGSYGHIKVN